MPHFGSPVPGTACQRDGGGAAIKALLPKPGHQVPAAHAPVGHPLVGGVIAAPAGQTMYKDILHAFFPAFRHLSYDGSPPHQASACRISLYAGRRANTRNPEHRTGKIHRAWALRVPLSCFQSVWQPPPLKYDGKRCKIIPVFTWKAIDDII